MTEKEKAETRVRTSNKFRLKLRYQKDIQVINLKDFGFIPEKILFRRVESSWFTVSAVLTDAEMKKEDKKFKEKDEAAKEAEKDVRKTMKEIKKREKK